ncbi:hypothetical protein JM93_04417 [Roseibium hamelinense]|uniref:Uncharacterized protein n=1 Tax=Roseibium hamelinense TaxID=150831 RepID=A0A562SBK3_9HYPH|nr:hypothetical protein JM93_04417 [Roseibium hamelinense]
MESGERAAVRCTRDHLNGFRLRAVAVEPCCGLLPLKRGLGWDAGTASRLVSV